MTPQEVDTLPEGRELDTLVAEKVMGWHLWQIYADANYFAWIAANGDWTGWRTENEYEYQMFAPSTDIAAAWLVVEAMRAKGWKLGLDDSYLCNEWWAHFGTYIDGKKQWTGMFHAIEPSLAICRAALKAVTQTVEGAQCPPSLSPSPTSHCGSSPSWSCLSRCTCSAMLLNHGGRSDGET